MTWSARFVPPAMRWIPIPPEEDDGGRPTRPMQARSGAHTAFAPYESRPHPGAGFYCVPLIVFSGAIVDFEAQTIAIRHARYLLGGSSFALLVALLCAEGEPIAKTALMRELGIPAGRSGVTKFGLLIRGMRSRMRAKGQEHLLETSRDFYRLRT